VLHVHAMGSPDDRGSAIVDTFRVKDGRIVEHWYVIQAISERPPTTTPCSELTGTALMGNASRPAWSDMGAAAIGLALMWGAALASPQLLQVACIGPLSGPTASAADARALREGIEAHFALANAEGGARGRTLVLQVLDDRYDGA
jgi:hypothetical protein